MRIGAIRRLNNTFALIGVIKNMKLSKIVHLLVACILLFSTIGVVVNKHYSGGKLFSTALFVEAESCCETSCCCSKHDDDCAEEADYYRLIADYIIPENSENANFDVNDFTLIAINFGSLNIGLNSNVFFENLALRKVDPPPILIDLPILFHSLLI